MRVDKDDNIWATDKGSDMVVKFTPEGRVEMVFGRKSSVRTEAHPHGVTPIRRSRMWMAARQPTDVTWDAQGNIYISDGYVNSRVAKYDKNGDWVKPWGSAARGRASSTWCTASHPTPRATSMWATAQPAHPGVRR